MADINRLLRAINQRITSGKNIQGQVPDAPVKQNYRVNQYATDDYGIDNILQDDIRAYSEADALNRYDQRGPAVLGNTSMHPLDPDTFIMMRDASEADDVFPLKSAHQQRKDARMQDVYEIANDRLGSDGPQPDGTFDNIIQQVIQEFIEKGR